MLKVAIKDVLEEQRSEATASGENNGYPWIPTPKSKSKTRNQKKTEFDESRKMTPTSGSDPRMLETQWPCHGAHQITYTATIVTAVGETVWRAERGRKTPQQQGVQQTVASSITDQM